MLKAIFFNPFYNALVVLAALVPGNDLGIAIIILTLLVKGLLAPFAHRALKMQRSMRELEPKMKALKEKHTNQEEQALKMMELYREHGVNPFTSIFIMLIQIPIIFGLYFVFRTGVDLSSPDLYSFILRPDHISNMFLGIVDLAKPSIVLGLLAMVTQFFQTQLSVPPAPKPAPGAESSFQDEFARSMSFQARFILPVFIFIVSLKLQAALPLYWATSNLFGIAHELYIRREAKKIQA